LEQVPAFLQRAKAICHVGLDVAKQITGSSPTHPEALTSEDYLEMPRRPGSG